MCECPFINVLSIETSCLNVETEPRAKWCGDGKLNQLSPGYGGEFAQECLSTERSSPLNVETEPRIWRGVHK